MEVFYCATGRVCGLSGPYVQETAMTSASVRLAERSDAVNTMLKVANEMNEARQIAADSVSSNEIAVLNASHRISTKNSDAEPISSLCCHGGRDLWRAKR